MCFSAGASFGVSTILGIAGVIAIKKTTSASQIPFAGIPLLFAAQQVCEGLLWLSLTQVAYETWQMSMTYIFLFFAQVLWPFWVPVSIVLLEHSKIRKKLLYGVSVIGTVTSCLLVYRLTAYPVSAEIKDHHIYYSIQSSQFLIITSSILYFIAVIIPPFISSVKGMRLLGFLLFASLLASEILYQEYLVSVWCFFAAILSVIIIYIMKKKQNLQVVSGN